MKDPSKASVVSILITIILVLSAANAVHAVEATPSIAWSKTYSGSGAVAYSVIQIKDGGFLMLCTDLGSQGVFYLLKVDSSGNQQWNRTYEGIIPVSGQYIVQTSDGGYAVAADYQNCFLLIKINQSGNQQWNQTYAGAGICEATGLVQTSDGGYALVGYSNSGNSVWLVKTDSSGNPQWNQTLGKAKDPSLIQTDDGGFAIIGSPDDAQFMLEKVDTQGNLQWNITYGGAGIGLPYSVVQTSDGGYAVGGWMYLLNNEGPGPQNVVIVKTDAEGNVQWTQNYGAGLVPYTMTKTSDGGFALAGDRLVKVDAAGSEQWEISFGGQAFPGGQASSVVQTQDGGYAIAGQTLPPPDYSSANPCLTKIDVANTNQTTQPTTSPSPTAPASPSPTVPEFGVASFFLVMAAAGISVVAFVRFKSKWKAFL